jgi:hypothetical protein
MSSERTPLGIREFAMDGSLLSYFNVPDYYFANGDGSFGTRGNAGLEGLTLTPNGKYLWALNEAALVQDGPAPSVDTESPCRLLNFDMASGNTVRRVTHQSLAVHAISRTGHQPRHPSAVQAISRTGHQPHRPSAAQAISRTGHQPCHRTAAASIRILLLIVNDDKALSYYLLEIPCHEEERVWQQQQQQ